MSPVTPLHDKNNLTLFSSEGVGTASAWKGLAEHSHGFSPVSRCMCPAENTGCRDQPFTILFRDMDVVSGRSVPADIFQMQATTRYPGAYYIFQIKSGNEGREFYMR